MSENPSIVGVILGLLLLGTLVAIVGWGCMRLLAAATMVRASDVGATTLGALSVLPDILGRPFQSIEAGLLATAVLLGGLALLVRRDVTLERPPRFSIAECIVLATVFACVCHVALTTYIWDGTFTHYGLVSDLARGTLPAVHPAFPTEPFRYHAGFDVLAGLIRRFTGAEPSLAIDLATLAFLTTALWVLRDLGRDLADHAGGCALPVAALFGFGPLAPCAHGVYKFIPSCSAWVPDVWIARPAIVPPPVISNFFQPAHAAGTAFILVLLRLGARGDRQTLSCCQIGLVMLSQLQVGYFACAGLSLFLYQTWHRIQTRNLRAWLIDCVAFSVVLLCAYAVGGVLRPGGTDAGFQLVFSSHFAMAFNDTPLLSLVHHTVLFGAALLLPAAAAAVARHSKAPQQVAVLTMTAAIAITVPLIISYGRTWDIVKFYGLFLLLANAIVAAWILHLPARPVLRTALLVFMCYGGIVWALRFGLLNGVIAPEYRQVPPRPIAVALGKAFGDVAGGKLILTDQIHIVDLGFHVFGAHPERIPGSAIISDEDKIRNFRKAQELLRELDPSAIAAVDIDYVFLSEDAILDNEGRGTRFVQDARVHRQGIVESGGKRYVLFGILPHQQ